MIKRYFDRLPFPIYHLIIGILLICGILGMHAFFEGNFSYNKSGEKKFSMALFVTPAVNFVFWGILSPLVYRISERVQFSKKTVVSDFSIVLIMGLGLSLFHEFTTTSLYYAPRLIANYERNAEWVFNFLNANYFIMGTSSRFIEFTGIFTLFIAIRYYRISMESKVKLQTMVNELQAAQLQALKMQLQPHFLFNTMNTISSLVDEDQEMAQSMISKLGDLLRSILSLEKKAEITLEKELEFIKNYLGIEKVRFSDKLVINYDIDDELLDVKVPTLILQPLVENAMIHGFEKKLDQCELSVKGHATERNIVITIKDNGAGSKTFKEELTGLGLSNVKDRLQNYYGEKAELILNNRPGIGFESRIVIKKVK